MTTQANPEGETQVDWKAKAEENEANFKKQGEELESLKKSHASVQRTLERTRSRASEDQRMSDEIRSVRDSVAALAGVIGKGEDLDPESKALLTGVTQTAQISRQQADTINQVRAQIANLAGEAGISDWNDPRAADVVEAVSEGDWMEALHLAKALRRTNRTVTKPETKVEDKKEEMSDELKIKAEVDRQLRAAGVRTVDNGKAPGPTPSAATYADLLKVDIRKMTQAQLKAHSKAIQEARRA